MRKRLFGLLILLVLSVVWLPFSAKAVTVDPNYQLITRDRIDANYVVAQKHILPEGTYVYTAYLDNVYACLDGGSSQKLEVHGIFAEAEMVAGWVLPTCESGYWFVKEVEIEDLLMISRTYTFHCRQVCPLTFIYADVGEDDRMFFAFSGSDDRSDVSELLPQRTGYSFLGWYTQDGTQVYDKTGKAVAGDYWDSANKWIGSTGVTLYPKWEANTYTATLDANGGTCGTPALNATFDSSYGTLPEPQRLGFDFLGWYTEREGGTKIEADTLVSIPRDHTLYAQWSANVNTITAVVNERYGTAIVPPSAATMETVSVIATPKTGCRLDRILVYATDDPSQTVNVDAENRFVMPGYPVTVEVVFAPYLNEITMNVAASEYGSCSVDRSTAGVGDVVTITAQPNKGCYVDLLTVTPTDPAYTVTVAQDGTFVMPPCAVTVDVRFARSVYTITLQTPDAEKGTLEINQSQAFYGEQITLSVRPMEGYAIRAIVITDESGNEMGVSETFSMPDSDITIRVTFMVVPTYTVTIPATVNLDGEPMTLSVNDVVMEDGVKLQVLLHTDLTVRTAEGAVNTYSINGGTVTDGSAVLTVDGGGNPEAPKNGSVALHFTRNEAPKYSGTYQGTISFTIRMMDTAIDYQ